MVAGAFRAALEAQEDLVVVGAAQTLTDALHLLRALRPDVVVLDYRLPDGEVGDHLAEVFDAHPDVRVLVVTGWASERALVRSVEAGVHGFLSKSQPVEDFVNAVRHIAAGEAVFAPDVLARLLTHLGRGGRRPADSLTSRELEVLQLLSEGRATQEIAQKLFLSVNTVRNHVASILGKLGVRSRLEAVTEGMRLGLIAAPDATD